MRFLVVCGLAAAFVSSTSSPTAETEQGMRPISKADVEKHLSGWKAKPKEAAMMLMQKYGAPHEATSHRLVWHDNGPWKMTEIINEEIPHDFPMPHVDFMYQAVSHKIDAGKADEITEFDGSVYVDRTRGLLGARCDKEEPNFLGVNLAHEIMMGKRDVDDARKMFAESMMTFMKTKKANDYQSGLKFQPMTGMQGDRDKAHSMK